MAHPADARVAITAVNPAPLLVRDAQKFLLSHELNAQHAAATGELAAKIARPLTTSVLTPEYRREMIRVLTKRALLEFLPKN